MTTEMFDKLDALDFILLPEFQMTINTSRYDEVRPTNVYIIKCPATKNILINLTQYQINTNVNSTSMYNIFNHNIHQV